MYGMSNYNALPVRGKASGSRGPRARGGGQQTSIKTYCYYSVSEDGGTSLPSTSSLRNQNQQAPQRRGASTMRGRQMPTVTAPKRNTYTAPANIDDELWENEFDDDLRMETPQQSILKPLNSAFRQPAQSVTGHKGTSFRSKSYGMNNNQPQPVAAAAENYQFSPNISKTPVAYRSSSRQPEGPKIHPQFDDFYEDYNDENVPPPPAPQTRDKSNAGNQQRLRSSTTAADIKQQETAKVSKYPKYNPKEGTEEMSGGASLGGAPLAKNFPRILTITVPKLLSWASKHVFDFTGEVLFEVFGILDSVCENNPPGQQRFILKGQAAGKIECIFYTMDRKLQFGSSGQWQRCVGLMKEKHSFQCLNIRSPTPEELRYLDVTVTANSKAMATMMRFTSLL